MCIFKLNSLTWSKVQEILNIYQWLLCYCYWHILFVSSFFIGWPFLFQPIAWLNWFTSCRQQFITWDANMQPVKTYYLTNSTASCASQKCMGSSFQMSIAPLISFYDFSFSACKKIFVFRKIKSPFLSNLENWSAQLAVEMVPTF